jgi:hypothetical protein
MRLTAALRLKPGAIVIFGNDTYTARSTQAWKGAVLEVDRGGRVKVRVIDARPWRGEQRYVKEMGCDIRWISYRHII